MAVLDIDAVASHARRIGLIRYEDKCCVYLMRSGDFTKVGIAADVEVRRQKLQMATPHPVTIYAQYGTGARKYALLAERFIHEDLKEYRMHGEWFNAPIETVVESAEWTMREVRKMRRRDTIEFQKQLKALCRRYQTDRVFRREVDEFHALTY